MASFSALIFSKLSMFYSKLACFSSLMKSLAFFYWPSFSLRSIVMVSVLIFTNWAYSFLQKDMSI